MDQRKVSFATAMLSAALCLFSTQVWAQAGTCAGMTVGQLTSLNGYVPFPASSLWNTNISAAPVDPNSANIISFIGSSVTLHPDFGSAPTAGRASASLTR